MKKNNLSFLICVTLPLTISSFFVQPTLALTSKTTPTVVPSITKQVSPSITQNSDLVNKIDQQISTLKEKIASRVAQLNLVEKRGIIGTFVESSGTEMQVTDTQNNIRYIDVDELTNFSSPSAKTFGISDIQKGTTLGILGNYNKESKRILARFVSVITLPQTVSGTVASIDKKNYMFTLTTSDNKSQLIDIENTSKTFIYTRDGGLKKAGFSKITQDTNVYVVGYPDSKVANEIVASRVILLPDLSATPDITSPTSTPTVGTLKRQQ